jgi:crotonobetainyl-CoA:carnitine CoA-transferase CaiB-like acyl-CoA transferase
VRHRALVDAAIGAWFATRARDAALAEMRAAGATVGPVYNIADALDDPHFQEREIVVALDDAEFGDMPMHNVTPRLSQTPGSFRRPAPALNENGPELLAELGFDRHFRRVG